MNDAGALKPEANREPTFPERELRQEIRDAANLLAIASVNEKQAGAEVLRAWNRLEAALLRAYPAGGGPR